MIRVNEIDRFAAVPGHSGQRNRPIRAGEDYEAALAGTYIQRGDEPPLRDDVSAAGAGFSDSAQSVFTNADQYVNDALTNFAAALRRRAKGG